MRAIFRLAPWPLMAALTILLGAETAAAQPPQGAPPLPPARKIPGITAPDTHPGACVDCHINYKQNGLDARFSTILKEFSNKVPPEILTRAKGAAPAGLTVKGQHPAVPPTTFQDIPNTCLGCHNRATTIAPPFIRLIHAIHLTGGEQNHFLTMFQGECTLCHKLNKATGAWTIPSGPEK